MMRNVDGRKKMRHLLDVGLFLFLMALLLGSLVTKSFRTIQAAEGAIEPTRPVVALPPLQGGSQLFATSTEMASLLAARAERSSLGANGAMRSTASDRLLTLENPEAHLAHDDGSTGGDGHTTIGALFPSPNGQRVAVQVHMGPTPVVWILDLQDRSRPTVTRLTAEGVGEFLAWHPNGEHVLYKVLDQDVADPGLWLVNTVDGSHRRIDIPQLVAPEGLMAAAVSPDGQTIAYAITKGLGFGSSTWLCNLDGTNHRQVRADEVAIVSGLTWAPDGSKVAFTMSADSPTPFIEAGLWTMNEDGSAAEYLTRMDGGHGQLPLWSRDGQTLFFVARENYDDVEANHRAEALVSSIRAVNVETKQETILVSADGARQIDLTLRADGTLLFASDRADDTLEVWGVSANGRLHQITTDGEAKRHPLFIP